MKTSIILYSVFIGFATYSLLFFIEGDTGIKAMKKVDNYKQTLNVNLDEIHSINNGLTIYFDSLSSDNETIKLKARALGYFDKGDHIVHISNWNPDINEYKPGHVKKEEYLSESNNGKFRLASFLSSIFTCFFLLLIKKSLVIKNRIKIKYYS